MELCVLAGKVLLFSSGSSEACGKERPKSNACQVGLGIEVPGEISTSPGEPPSSPSRTPASEDASQLGFNRAFPPERRSQKRPGPFLTSCKDEYASDNYTLREWLGGKKQS